MSFPHEDESALKRRVYTRRGIEKPFDLADKPPAPRGRRADEKEEHMTPRFIYERAIAAEKLTRERIVALADHARWQRSLAEAWREQQAQLNMMSPGMKAILTGLVAASPWLLNSWLSQKKPKLFSPEVADAVVEHPEDPQQPEREE